jgi:hypothetical protein
MVELALVLPLFVMILVGIITLGVGLFYQQQVTNAAREAARYASVSSATSPCPTVSHLDPDINMRPRSYYRCEGPEHGWPTMVAEGRSLVFGLPSADVHFSACWSGYWTKDGTGAWADFDAPPPGDSVVPTYFRGCTIGGVDPRTGLDAISGDAVSLPCPPPLTGSTDDTASDLSSSAGTSANEVTVYACYQWRPPMAGFLLIPEEITLRAIVSQAMQYQQ